MAASPQARVGVAGLAALLIAAWCGPWLIAAPEPGVHRPLQPPSAAAWLGTDGQGQDALAVLVHGAWPTLAVGLGAAALATALGAAVGLVAGLARPSVAALAALLTDVVLVIPGLPLMVLVSLWLPPGPATMALVLALTGWPWGARVVASQVRVWAGQPWVESAWAIGEPAWRVALVEVLPHLAPVLAAGWTGAAVWAIGAEVGLELVGLGDVDAATWGTMLYWAANDAALLTSSWWTFLPPGLAIAVTGVLLTWAGQAAEEAADPRIGAMRAWSARVGDDPGGTPRVDP